MPPKKATIDSGAEGAAFNSGEETLVKALLESMAPAAKDHVDWDKLCTKLNLHSAKGAKDKFRPICKKYKWFEYADGNNNGNSNNKKRAADGAEENTGKKTKAKKAKKAEVKEDEDDSEVREDGEDGEE